MQYNFVENDVCSYIIHTPPEMTYYDALKVKIISIEETTVYVAKAKKDKYFWLNHLDTWVSGNG